MDLLVASEIICLMSACPILLDLVHSFLSVVCVEMTCFAPCLSFLWDYGDAQWSPMMYSYKRLCYVTHIIWLSLNLLNVLAFGYFVGLLFDAQPYDCCKCYALFYIFSLAHVLCFKGLWGSDDSIFVHVVLKYTISK